jgi:hypothetical protein
MGDVAIRSVSNRAMALMPAQLMEYRTLRVSCNVVTLGDIPPPSDPFSCPWPCSPS